MPLLILTIAVEIAAQGIEVSGTVDHGIIVQNAGEYGIYVADTEYDGLHISGAGYDGLYIYSPTDRGVHVNGSGDDGIFVSNVGDDGVHVGGAEGYSLHIRGDKSVANQLTGHIALLRNESTGSSADVLALQVETINPGAGANYITFYDGNEAITGQVQGNGSGGISYESTGADYAEYLPAIDPGDEFQAGDIVYVHEGKISHRIEGAQKVMVITEHAAVVGNQPQDTRGYEKVSFMGQVPVRVQGPVAAGDWIVTDGTGAWRGCGCCNGRY